jgi:hypothetical protein
MGSPISLDGVGFEPTRYIEEVDKNATYYECPAWQHKAVREFVIRSVRDITLEIDTVNGVINSPNMRPDQFHKYIHQHRNFTDFNTIQLPIQHFFLDNIFSQDTWIFHSPMKYPINIRVNMNLGEMFSDSYLNYKLFRVNIQSKVFRLFQWQHSKINDHICDFTILVLV